MKEVVYAAWENRYWTIVYANWRTDTTTFMITSSVRINYVRGVRRQLVCERMAGHNQNRQFHSFEHYNPPAHHCTLCSYPYNTAPLLNKEYRVHCTPAIASAIIHSAGKVTISVGQLWMMRTNSGSRALCFMLRNPHYVFNDLLVNWLYPCLSAIDAGSSSGAWLESICGCGLWKNLR
jgi:hypothetical protein